MLRLLPFARRAEPSGRTSLTDATSIRHANRVRCASELFTGPDQAIYFANTRDDAAVIGFDDRTIYDEFTRPHSDRKIPMIQVLRDEALVAFREWQEKNDKVPY
jgi:hypothetical protein